MLEYFVQNKDLWILVVLGVPAILTTLYYQINVWRRNYENMSVPLTVIVPLALVSPFILPRHVPYPPFTWVQWLWENIPSDCGADGCWQEIPYAGAFLLMSVAISAVSLVILWGPWLLSPWRHQYLEKCKAEEAARKAEAARLAVAAQPFRRGDTEDFLKDP